MYRTNRVRGWYTAVFANFRGEQNLARVVRRHRPSMMNPSQLQSALALAASRKRSRGFTLAEMMAVVVIIGILATLAVVGYRKYINSARGSEAAWMVNGIRAAQEAYRAETLSYLNVSTNINTFYPTGASPTNKKVQWGGAGPDVARWRILNVTTDGAVYYGYACVAGGPGAIDLSAAEGFSTITAPDAIEPWYAVQAKGNVDGDSEYSYYFASSFSNEVYWLNEGE
jgi:type IV pilus assembly protein PilA